MRLLASFSILSDYRKGGDKWCSGKDKEKTAIDGQIGIKLAKIQLHHVVAFVLSLVAHSWLVYFVHIDNPDSATKPVTISSPPMATVQLIRFDGAGESPDAEKPDLQLANSDDRRSVEHNTESAEVPSLPRSADSAPPPLSIHASSDPYYFHTSELTTPPQVLQDVLALQPLKLSGTKSAVVILRLLVNDSGEVDQVIVQDSDLPAESTKTLVEKFLKMKFEPGKINDVRVKSQLTIEVDATPFHQ